MALVNLKAMLHDANKEGYAVGNFDCFNVEMVKGVLDAAEKNRAPVIIAYAELFEDLIPVDEFASYVRAYAQKLSVPVALHLDHANNFDFIERAVKAGFTSVMIDASDKAFDENIAITNRAAEICRAYDVSVEAELGHVGGNEGQYESDDYKDVFYTVVDEAVTFMRETHVDVLAVAIGTVHGVYKSEPSLSISRLKEIKAALPIPLALHGGSGLSDVDIKECVSGGINKFNIFTDLTLAAMETMKRNANLNVSYLEKCLSVTAAVHEVARDRMAVFGSTGRIK